MPSGTPRRSFTFRITPAVLLAVTFGLAAPAQDAVPVAAEPSKTAPVPKDSPKAPPPVGIELPDGTTLWNGPAAAGSERVLLSPRDYQKLLDQVEQLKKQLAARKGVPPGGCAVGGRIERRGETLVAALRLTVAFRTTIPNTAVSLGGRRAFLVAASREGKALPVLEAGEDGFTALMEAPGNHTVTLDLEAPVVGRGAKTEIGFEIGLPRAAITTLTLEPPPGAGRVTLATRTPDSVQPGKPTEPRKVVGLDVKALAPRPEHGGYPLGPVDSLEVSWEPPAAAPPPDAARTADLDATCLVAEGFVETSAVFHPHGPAQTWRFAAPADAVVTVDRVSPTEPGTGTLPIVTKPRDPNRPVWTVALPAGTTAADWTVTAVVRTPRPRSGDAKHRGPFSVGPFAALDTARQKGEVKVIGPANTRLVVKRGPDVRQDVPSAPVAEDQTTARYRFATGPAGSQPPAAPLLTVEAVPVPGKVAIRPTYKFTLTEAGWRVRAELRVFPIRTEIDAVTVELPAGWRGPEISPPELVAGAQTGKSDGSRQILTARLASAHRQAFDLVLTAFIPVTPEARTATVLLPRYPNATEQDAAFAATVPEGLEVRGAVHEWDGDQPAGWGQPLAANPAPEGATMKAVSAVSGKFDRGLARVDLAWSVYRPPLAVDLRAEVSVREGQLVIRQRMKLRSPDGFPRPIRFRGASHRTALPPLDRTGPGEWTFTPSPEAKDTAVTLDYAVPLPRRPAEGAWLVPVPLVWPVDSTRTESVVRVWVNSDPPRSVGVEPGVWRELPPEPVPERDVLPALTLAGTGGDLPLTLDVRDAIGPQGVSVWADRGLIQAWNGDDGTTAVRARFLLSRWLGDAVEVRLPAAADAVPEVWLGDPLRDERTLRVNAAIGTADGLDRVVRVPLPESKPGRGPLVLDVHYRLSAGNDRDPAIQAPPRLSATRTGPVRWQVMVPDGEVPLVFAGGPIEQRWRLRSGLLTPVGPSSDDLDRWLLTGTEGNDGRGAAGAAVIRTNGTETVRVYRVSRVVLAVACSSLVFLIGLAAARLPGALAGPAVAVLAGLIAVAAILIPQPAAAAAGAAGPGGMLLVLVVVGQAVLRWRYRQRIAYLPGFARTRLATPAEPVVLPPAPARESGSRRPLVNGTGTTADPGYALGPQTSATG